MPSPRRAPEPPEGGGGEFSGWIDGGARGNPGPAGIGLILEENEGGREEVYGYLGTATNNVAEYVALLTLLHHSRQRQARRLVIHSDSELLVRQMLGTYRVKNPRLQILHAEARRLMEGLSAVEFRHVPREANRDADRLANRAMDERMSSEPLPAEVLALLSAAPGPLFADERS